MCVEREKEREKWSSLQSKQEKKKATSSPGSCPPLNCTPPSLLVQLEVFMNQQL